MAKQPKATPEERLNKALDGLALFEDELQLLLPAQVWPYVETLARLQLLTDTKESRDLIAQLALACRQEALRRFGHDTLETFKLARLLREGTDRWHPKPPTLDAITHINNYSNKHQRFTMEQDAAANNICVVWSAFGKFLEIAGRGIGGGGSARSQALGPVDVMGQDLWDHHREVFKPWQFAASRAVVRRRSITGNNLTIAAVVFKVLVEDMYPEDLDHHFALLGGTALKAVKAGLDAYHDPKRLTDWGKTPQNTPPAPQTGGQGARQPSGGSPTAPKRPPGLWVPPVPKLPPGGKVKLGPRKKKHTGD